MIKRSIIILVGLVMLVTALPAYAQALPLSPWYAVVYQPETDTLHWINGAGEQTSIPRPMLPNEAQYLDMRISPNGQQMVMVSQLNSGLESIGIYDFASGVFLQTHQANVGEQIELGGENIFSANSQYFAVGLFSGDFENPAWRVILFESQTGNATAFIDHTHPDAPEVQLSAPSVQYLDGMFVHFQLIPQSVGGWHTWPAFAWQAFGFDPAIPAISESPYARADVKVLPLTGQAVMSFADENFAAVPPDGPGSNFNAIGTGILANSDVLTTVHADGTRYHYETRWAKGGEWILFSSNDMLNNKYWNIVLANGTPGNNSHMPFDPQFTHTFGTSDGYLLVNNTFNLFYTNGFMPNTALNIAQLTPQSKVVYVTPIGVNFMLAQVSNGNAQPLAITPTNAVNIVTPTPQPITETPVAPVDCSTAPAQRVGIGTQARVLPSMGGLNLRQNPNSTIIATLSGGDTFNVIGGSICDGGLYWWQIDRFGLVGWLAEGTATGYFIEPYAGPPVTDATDTPVPPPPPEEEDEFVGPPAPTCDSALATRVSVGNSATIVAGELRPRNGPNGEVIARRFFQSGTSVSITAGPECSGNQFWWLVTGPAKIGRIGNQVEMIQAWIPEASSNAYNIAPQ